MRMETLSETKIGITFEASMSRGQTACAPSTVRIVVAWR